MFCFLRHSISFKKKVRFSGSQLVSSERSSLQEENPCGLPFFDVLVKDFAVRAANISADEGP